GRSVAGGSPAAGSSAGGSGAGGSGAGGSPPAGRSSDGGQAGSSGLDDLAGLVLAGLAAGRTAVSSRPDGPLLLPAGDRALAVDADGLTLRGTDGTATTVAGDLVELPVGDGVYWLESAEGVEALCVPGRVAGANGPTGEDGLVGRNPR
ncbi:MAG TPA: hypothetical protein VKV06_11125, partial [Acidimicrobiales bacterium]|nr:hypothetical protein [Acidimicrobiales bacterium]